MLGGRFPDSRLLWQTPSMNESPPVSRRTPFLSNRRLAWLFVLTAVMAVVAIVVVDNFVIVNVRILTWQMQARLGWVMLTCLSVGTLVGCLLTLIWRRYRGYRSPGESTR